MDYSISIYLDGRRTKANGKCPVKLRVFTSAPRKQKLYPTEFELSKAEFASTWETVKPRNEYKDIRLKLQALELRASNIAKSLVPFSIQQFEKRMYRKDGDGSLVSYHFDQVLSELETSNQVKTASTYNSSRKSLKAFVELRGGCFETLRFQEINAAWLEGYERHMTESMGRSLTTVSMYLRSLKALFNKAIDENEIERKYYPFGKRKYQVPAVSKVKKALSKADLGILLRAEPLTKQQAKAKDFWFLSYVCNGMNIKDIALLRHKDIDSETIHFIRSKTKRTSKGQLKAVTVVLTPFVQEIIAKYGNSDRSPESLVFDIVNDGQTAKEQHASINNFNRFIGQHIKRLCLANELTTDISPMWARHSFATFAKRSGKWTEFIQEALGHTSKKTTETYLDQFEIEEKREFANTLMEFD